MLSSWTHSIQLIQHGHIFRGSWIRPHHHHLNDIKNKPKINEDPKDAMLREYQEEIQKLKSLLESQGPEAAAGDLFLLF